MFELDSTLDSTDEITITELKEKLFLKFPNLLEINDFNNSSLNQINVVFLSGETCKTPFIQERIQSMFPETHLIIDDELENITAKGAAVHALQISSNETLPFVSFLFKGKFDTSSGIRSVVDNCGIIYFPKSMH